MKFPELNHEICQLEPHEQVVADYFESRGLNVERLCAVKSNEKAPDFRITGKGNFVCVCEVKKPKSPIGSLSNKDREYLDRAEFEKLIEEAENKMCFLLFRSNNTTLITARHHILTRKEIQVSRKKIMPRK